MTAGVQGNIIRRNLLEGNPPVQIAVDHAPNTGFDIKNLDDTGANTFVANVCATAVNAPCPSLGPTLMASPNPISITGSTAVGSTTISWNAPGTDVIEIRIGKPDGQLFTRMGNRGSIQTGNWVSDGMIFYLQDVSSGRPLTSDYTLATIVMHLQRSNSATVNNGVNPHRPFDPTAILPGVVVCGILLWSSRSPKKWARVSPAAVLLLAGRWGLSETATEQDQDRQTSSSSASATASGQQTSARLDQMMANGATPKELAQYVFDTHGCKSCHTVGQDGKLGFTAKGKERAQGFEGCISTLKAMSVIAKIPKEQRSATQRERAQRFDEFGCATCHRVTLAKMDLTPVGAKLADLHVGCVDVEKLLANKRTPQR